MKILVSGASGLVGGALRVALRAAGHDVLRLVRRPATAPDEVTWDPAAGQIDAARLAGVSAVVHLAGENIAGGRWTAARKQRLRDSRVDGTRLLATTLAGLSPRPQVLVSASAIGIYGSRGDEWLTEESAPGTDFLARVGQEWEQAAQPAAAAGIRVVLLRLGVILTPHGGALAKMLPAFRCGLGGPVGDGRQYLSWISLPDVVGVIDHALSAPALSGPVNTVAPEPVTNRELARALGAALHRPAVVPVPALALKLALGEMAEATLLASQRVSAAKLLASGYPFRHPRLPEALTELLGPSAATPA